MTTKTDPIVLDRIMAMKRMGLTQPQLAADWGKSQSFISQLVHGKCRSEVHEKKFAKAVRVARATLFPPAT